MAKAPATVERFRIHAETSKEHMGHVLAELTKMGLENVGFELVTDVLTFRSKNGPRKVHEVRGIDLLREFLQENASFTTAQLNKYFATHDRPASTTDNAIRTLINEGAIKRLSIGNYQRADVKALAPPAPKGNAPKGRGGAVRRHEIGNKDVILKRIKGRAKFTLKELRDHFRNIRRNPNSVSPIISKLFHAKLITQLEDGVYAWGKKKKITKKIAVRKKRGAPVASPQLEETNG